MNDPLSGMKSRVIAICGYFSKYKSREKPFSLKVKRYSYDISVKSSPFSHFVFTDHPFDSPNYYGPQYLYGPIAKI